MSGGLDIFALKEDDVTKMLAAHTHQGSENVNFQMEQYVYKRRAEGGHIINLGRTWEKLLLAARAIAAIDHMSDVSSVPIYESTVEIDYTEYILIGSCAIPKNGNNQNLNGTISI